MPIKIKKEEELVPINTGVIRCSAWPFPYRITNKQIITDSIELSWMAEREKQKIEMKWSDPFRPSDHMNTGLRAGIIPTTKNKVQHQQTFIEKI